jgi:DNA processing protein
MPMSLNQRQALLVLNGLPYVGPVMLRRLMDDFDRDAVAVLSASRSKLLAVKGIGEKAADALLHWMDRFDLTKEVAHMRRTGTRFFIQEDDKFPALLRETYDPPIGLYWQGEYIVDRPCVAIVGTRRSTLYGRSVTRQFASELARLGFCVVSGMASGTDTAAHEGALEAGGKTVAVFGCGLDTIYPPENKDLYHKIVAHGAVASEFPFGRRADRQTFPMRNRVVAGMCQGVIVIESAVSGGSMITARFAGEQGRILMAVPGRVDQASSAGCHQLIRDGAIMVTSVDDILQELRYQRAEQPSVDVAELDLEICRSPSTLFSAAEQALLDCFEGGEVVSSDTLAERLGLAIADVAGMLMQLELKRMICKRADGRFEAR